MATKNQRAHKAARRAHHNQTNRTSVPNECIAKSRCLSRADLEAMNVTALRKLAKAQGVTGLSKATARECLAALAPLKIRKEAV